MPYACDRTGLVIRGVRVAVDDEPLGELASGGALSPSTRDWATLRLSVALERRVAIDRLLHADELDAPPLAFILAVHCRPTFLSLSQCIQPPDPAIDQIEHMITLRRNDIRGDVSVTPYLIRTTPHQRTAGLAWRKGAWLAKGDPWLVMTDETRPKPGNNLEVLRKRFSEVAGISPADHHNWFALQLDDATPRLFLNEEHTLVMAALYDTTRRGKLSAVREALYDHISATVWPALLLHAAHAWRDNLGDTYPWQENVLRLWAKRLWPDDLDLDAGVERLVDRAMRSPAELSLDLNAILQRGDQVRHIQRLLEGVSQ